MSSKAEMWQPSLCKIVFKVVPPATWMTWPCGPDRSVFSARNGAMKPVVMIAIILVTCTFEALIHHHVGLIMNVWSVFCQSSMLLFEWMLLILRLFTSGLLKWSVLECSYETFFLPSLKRHQICMTQWVYSFVVGWRTTAARRFAPVTWPAYFEEKNDGRRRRDNWVSGSSILFQGSWFWCQYNCQHI